MTNFVTFFNKDYTHEHIATMSEFLKANLNTPYQFECYTDFPIDSVDSLMPLQRFNDEWMLLNIFMQSGPTVFIDPNIFIAGNLDELSEIASNCSEDEIYLCRPKNKKLLKLGYWASRIIIFNGDFLWLLENFKTKTNWPAIYISEQLKKKKIYVNILQDEFEGIYYRDEFKSLPDNSKLILFNKRKNLLSSKDPWIKLPEESPTEEEYE